MRGDEGRGEEMRGEERREERGEEGRRGERRGEEGRGEEGRGGECLKCASISDLTQKYVKYFRGDLEASHMLILMLLAASNQICTLSL